MAASIARVTLMRIIIRGARLSSPTDPISALEAIMLGKFTTEVTNGKTVIKVAGNGMITEFAFPSDISSGIILAAVEDALTWLEAQDDPLDATLLPRAIKRLTASFATSRP
jgi:hypothetical protein